MSEFVKVASTNEIAPGQARLVNIKGKEIVLFNIEGTSLLSKMPARMRKGRWPREKLRATR
jgi:hypothetical protein